MKRKIVFVLFVLLTGTTFAQKPSDTLSLYFENDASKPTLKHHKIIDSTIHTKDSFSFKIDVIGYTNNIGSESYNLKLSKKRAEKIAEIIHPHSLGDVFWKGELPSISPDNRRVDLILRYEEITEIKEIVEKTDNSFTFKISETKVGDKIVLDNINFKGGRDDFTDTSHPALYNLLTYLKENPTITFKLQGHICCSPETDPKVDGVNLNTGQRNLSVARAYKVYWFLKQQGIDETRMSYEGFAHQFPLGLENEALDRRVEIEIITK